MRTFIIALIAFLIGFFVHAILFPDTFINQVNRATFLGKETVSPGAQDSNRSLTAVEYKNGNFSPNIVKITKSYYIGITNKSKDEEMFLTSDNPLLNTPRGYKETERLKVRLDEEGTFTVKNKYDNAQLIIIVK